MELERAQDRIGPEHRAQGARPERRYARSKQAASAKQSKLEKLLREMAEVIEAEEGILTP